MALINCVECGQMASDQAAACPHCGAPILPLHITHSPRSQAAEQAGGAPERQVGFALGLGIFLLPWLFVWFLLRQGHSTSSRIIGFGWLVLSVLLVGGADKQREGVLPASRQTPNQQQTVAEQPLLQVTAQQLAQAYDRNTVAADQQFKGKRFKVTGVVDAINTDMFGNPYVTLRGGVNQFMEPSFRLDEAYTDFAAKLHSGMRISLICTGRGDVAKTPMSKACTPAN